LKVPSVFVMALLVLTPLSAWAQESGDTGAAEDTGSPEGGGETVAPVEAPEDGEAAGGQEGAPAAPEGEAAAPAPAPGEADISDPFAGSASEPAPEPVAEAEQPTETEALEADHADSSDEDDGDVAIEAEVEEGDRLPFRGSVFIWENIFSAANRNDLSSDATFSYAMSYSFRPRYYFADWFSARVRFDLEQELTDSNTTTYENEVVWSDLLIDAYFGDYLQQWTEWLDLNTYLRLSIPTSKASQAQTLYSTVALGIGAGHTFDVLEGLTLSYTFEVTKYLNQYTTAVQEAPTLSCTPGADWACDSQINSGMRNASWRLRNMLHVDFSPVRNLTIAVDVLFYNSFLYDVTDTSTDDLANPPTDSDPDGSTIDEQATNTDHRAAIWYVIDISYQVLPWLALAVGTSTYNPQLAGDSTYYAPFFNRYTNVYLDVNITLDELVQAIRGRSSRRRNDGEV